jgi:hypothetical protein
MKKAIVARRHSADWNLNLGVIKVIYSHVYENENKFTKFENRYEDLKEIRYS